MAGIAPGLLFTVALLLFTTRLATPSRYIYDEVYHAYTAEQYVQGNTDAYVWYTRAPRPGVAYMWNHPPAGVLLIAGGILLWGDTSYGWRFPSALFGALGIVVFYGLALGLTRHRGIALLASGLLLLDGLYFVQARTGMLDTFGTVFMLSALFAFHRYWTSPPRKVRAPLLWTGLFLGLAIATKWNAAYASALIGLAACGRMVALAHAARRSPETGGGAATGGHLLWIVTGLGAVPALVYLAAYIPFFLTGHDLSQFFELQRQIYSYHSHLKATHHYQSLWWQWPLALRPVWYHVSYAGERIANIYAQGNPILHVTFLPAVLWTSWSWWKARDPALIVLLIGFFGQWLPWALVPRIAFMYHFLPAVPFGCLAVAFGLSRLAQRGMAFRVLAIAYVAAVAIAFTFFYPILAAVPLTRHAFDLRMWLPGWR